jgi:ABC-type glycerol-3-phosphate transport system substrate-binding protein
MRKTRLLSGVAALILLSALTGCTQSAKLPQGAYENEILTTTPVAQDKTLITIRVENNVCQTNPLEQVLEEEFPDVDFVLVHDGSINSMQTIKSNLKSGVECDIILSRRLSTVSDIAKDYLLDLSTENYVDNYYLTAIDSCTNEDGKLYYLPGPSDFYGIVYDKTLFSQYGWQPAHSYSEFKQLIETISQESDLQPLQPTIMYPDMFSILFNTYGYEEAFGGIENFRWLMKYQNGSQSMVGHMESAVDKFLNLFNDGILSVEDLNMTPLQRSNMLYVDHTAAMTVESQNAIIYSKTFAQAGGAQYHEVAMMPFWTSDEEDSDYLYAVPSYYMAINKQSAQESKSKKRLLLDVLGYLSSVEGQKKLLDGSLQISSVKGVEMEQSDFCEEVADTLNAGRVINAFYYAAGEDNKQVERQMLETFADMQQGKLSVRDWLLLADSARDDFLSETKAAEEVYGQVKTTMTKLESAYTVAQMYRSMTGAQIGICLGGAYRNGTNGYFYQGDITDASLECINPNKEPSSELKDAMEEKIVVASLSAEQIIGILNSVENIYDTKGEYPYYVASGLNVIFNPWADEGERVLSCTLLDGSELEAGKTYEVAYFNGSISDSSIHPERALSGTWKENFLTWLGQNGGVLERPDMTLELIYNLQ